jgi:hypothetical protein
MAGTLSCYYQIEIYQPISVFVFAQYSTYKPYHLFRFLDSIKDRLDKPCLMPGQAGCRHLLPYTSLPSRLFP